MQKTTVTKKYLALPFAHRQHTHRGHCAQIHGHSWDFEFVFEGQDRDENGFILDFGKLQWLKEWLSFNFDHTLALAENDPLLQVNNPDYMVIFKYANIVHLPSVSCEGIAQYVFEAVTHLLSTNVERKVSLIAVTVRESPTNSATFYKDGKLST